MEECAQCGKHGDRNTIRLCARCKTTRYCSRDCQARHWLRHKVTCRAGNGVGASTEQANQRVVGRTQRTRPRRDPNPWARLFTSLYTDPWQQARSRAESAFPGNRVSDTWSDLGLTSVEMVIHIQPAMPFMPFMPTPFMPFVPLEPMAMPMIRAVSQVVMVMKLVSPIIFPSLRVWVVKDSMGGQTHLVLNFPESSSPHFLCKKLKRGHFLCVKHAYIFLLNVVMHFIFVEDVNSVRALGE